MRSLFLAGLALSLFASCARNDFDAGKRAEKLGRYASAIEYYEQALTKDPVGIYAPEILYRLSRIDREILDDPSRFRTHKERLENLFPKTSWAQKAEKDSRHYPNYFPLRNGLTKVLGDSDSKGRYMRVEENYVQGSSQDQFLFAKKIYAGDQEVNQVVEVLERNDDWLIEIDTQSQTQTKIFPFPPKVGAQWESDGKSYEVLTTTAVVDTSLGTFNNCLKVQEKIPGIESSWRFLYYAPNKGQVLVVQATKKSQTRVLEILETTIQDSSKKHSFWSRLKNLFS